jgi:hypothetical protein
VGRWAALLVQRGSIRREVNCQSRIHAVEMERQSNRDVRLRTALLVVHTRLHGHPEVEMARTGWD